MKSAASNQATTTQVSPILTTSIPAETPKMATQAMIPVPPTQSSTSLTTSTPVITAEFITSQNRKSCLFCASGQLNFHSLVRFLRLLIF